MAKMHKRRIRVAGGGFILLLSGVCSSAFGGFFGGGKSDVAVELSRLSVKGSGSVQGVDFSPDGTRIAVDAEGPTVDLWDWRNKRIEKSLRKPHGGNDFQTIDPIRFSPNGRFLVNCEQSGEGKVSARIWNTADGTIARDIVGGSDPNQLGICMAFDFSPDSKVLYIASDSLGGEEGNIYAYDGTGFSQSWKLRIERFFNPISIAVSPDGELVAVAGSLAAPKNGKFGQELNVYVVSTRTREVIKKFTSAAMGSVAWSPDGKRVAIAGELMLSIFSVDTGECLVQESLPKSAHMNLRYTPDGRYLVVGDMNGRGTGLGVKIWDEAHGNLLQEIPGNIAGVAVSKDSRYLALGAVGSLTVWQLK